ncbi:GNAT family N-acetyltransferase [Dyadobacter jiangsuensis]|uniref:Acetyltransferase (GNAT) family protein n=1 Tax=Dyadobacter jiangsuensis TaxID=1591085 RepID=A0A2P8GEB4_9BACT|nr:GNAT family N-acetyltransferase [Dyadobacter jiangsuensis]PSL32324.1 acetyltransferase (GNAT) family protein [Dyadobacter jiangsuensis]
MTIETVRTDADILKCRGAIQALRPLLTDDIYTDAIKQTLADNRQIIFIEDGSPDAAAVAVFETGYNLFRGKYIYIDDLSTLPTQRGKGYAGMLLDWITEYARKERFNEIHLDSGVNAARTDAHRLYLNKRFQVASLHFVAKV